MTESGDLRRDNEELRASVADLSRRVADAELALEAFARGEVDAVAVGGSATPVLLQAAQAQLREHRQLLRAVFDSTMDAIMLADDDGTYVDANPAACNLFGLPREQLLGRSFADFTHQGDDGRASFREFRRVGRMAGLLPIRRPDGTTATLEYNAVADVVPGRHLSVLRDITDRIAAEAALRHNEALFRAVIVKSKEIISLTTADGTTRYLTPAAWQMLGWAPDEVGERSMRDQVVPEDRALIARELDRLIRTGARDVAFEIRVMHRDGNVRWIESNGTNLLDDPNVRAIVGNYRDITARKLADEALRASRDELEEAQTLAHLGRWAAGLAPDDEIVWSAECYRIYGFPAGTTVTKAQFFATVHPLDRTHLRTSLVGMLRGEGLLDLEHRVQRPDGTIRWVHMTAIVERDGANRPVHMRGTIQDVTDQHVAIAALQQSEERYRKIVENTSEGIWLYDARAVTTFMNRQMALMLGCTVDEAVGQSIRMFLDEGERLNLTARVERRRRGIAERSDVRLLRKDGSFVWCSIQSNPVFGSDGAFDGAIALVTDISMRRADDEARARLAAIVESSDDAIVSTAEAGKIATWNRSAETLYQYRASEVIGHPISILFTADTRDLVKRTHAFDTTHRRKDGSPVEVRARYSPVRSSTGAIIGTAMLATDLTAIRAAEATHRRTEEQFRQAQKMEAVGRLAGGIAHDFNNLLTVILSYSQFAIEDLKPGDPLRNDMVQINEAGERATALTRQLLAFSRQQVLQPRVLHLNEILVPMERMLRRLLGEDITLTLLMAPALGRVVADAGQLEQVVMNLAVNARDAMPSGGTLSIETGVVQLDANYAGGPAGITPGSYVLLAVSDTGVGMDADTCAKIFEPFFTTKEMGKGTGLGLSTVFGIVRQSGGHIGVYSEPGHGSTFKVYLPVTDRLSDARTSDVLPVVARGSETILLVEDEDQVRAVAAAILRRNGYNVLETSNGGEAFLVSKSFTATIHLLLTDVVMPRMSGRVLAEELVSQRANMRVLYASGYTDDTIIHHGVLEAGVAFIQKPFTQEALLRKVRDVLDAPSQASLMSDRGSSAHDAAARFLPLLAGLDQGDLTAVGDPTCGVFAADDYLIGYVNAAWTAFGIANGAARVWGPGDRLLDAMTEPLRSFYADKLALVRETGQPWEQDYECSSPALHREFRLRVLPIADGEGLLLTHSLRVEEPHVVDAEPLTEEECRASIGSILQCAHCRRIRSRVDPRRWGWVPKLVERAPPASISHGLCELCSAYYYGPARLDG